MNKKFFTLIASVFVLAGLVGTINAQTGIPGPVMSIGDPVKEFNVNAGAQDKLYQLGFVKGADKFDAAPAATDYLLTMDQNGVLKLQQYGTTFSGAYGASLWCIAKSEDPFSGGLPMNFQFTTRGSTQRMLMVSAYQAEGDFAPMNVNEGDISDWGFSNTSPAVPQSFPLYTYVDDRKSVLILLHSDQTYTPAGSTTATEIGLYVAKIPTNEFMQAAWGNDFTKVTTWQVADLPGGASYGTHSDNVLWATFMKPAKIVLTADDYNTKLGTSPDPNKNNYQKMSFTRDNYLVSETNPWSIYNLRAYDVVATGSVTDNKKQVAMSNPAADQISKTGEGWLKFQLKSDVNLGAGRQNDRWLRVDTAYSTDGKVTQYLLFNFDNLDDGGINYINSFNWNPSGSTAADFQGGLVSYQRLEGQHYFRLTYDVFNDHVDIDVASVIHNPTPTNGDRIWWRQVIPDLVTPANGAQEITAAPTGITPRGYIIYDQAKEPYHSPDEVVAAANTANPIDVTSNYYLRVSVAQISNTVSSPQLVTVGNYAETHGQLKLPACTADKDYLSLKPGLYTIQKKLEYEIEGGVKKYAAQAYGVPINTDSLTVGATKYRPVFYNLDDIYNPDYTPSSQWVVQRLRPSSETSPLVIINREFPQIRFSPVQLVNKKDARGDSYAKEFRQEMFIPVPDTLAKNPHLGYFWLPKTTTDANTYQFNYYHALDPTNYLGVDEQGRIKIGKAQAAFSLTPVTSAYNESTNKYDYEGVEYGYKPTADELKAGIAQLKRLAYNVTIDGTPMRIDNNRQIYTINTSRASVNGLTDQGVFFFKSYHKIGEKQYYALLDTNSFYGRKAIYAKDMSNASAAEWVSANRPVDYGTNNLNPDYIYNFRNFADYKYTDLHISYTKLSIADGSIVAFPNVQRESRTSAFNIGVFSAPLYRRFDGKEYYYGNGEEKTKEEFQGDSADIQSPLYLEFHDMILKDMYLFENRDTSNRLRKDLKDSTISFLGIQDRIHYKEGEAEWNKPYYQFFVDTAFVKRTSDGRPTTNYEEYTPMPQYMLAVRPIILDEGKVWYKEGGDMVWQVEEPTGDVNPDWGKWHSKSVDRLVRGYYVFNAQDSINRGKLDYQGKKADNILNDVRLAFVDGVHYLDTFYVLPDSSDDPNYAYTKEATFKFQKDPQLYLFNLPYWKKHALNENTHYEPRWSQTKNSNGAINTPVRPNTVWMKTTSGDIYSKNYSSNLVAGEDEMLNGKSMVFQFRLRNNFISGEEPNSARNFFIESQTDILNYAQIAPAEATYIKNHNGAAIITDMVKIQNNDPTQSNDAALGFNVTQNKSDNYGKPELTANEAAQLSDAARVISGVNQISILNAAGKTVTVTNVLGQTVAKTVATSDNATITLPKGIVVVSVDGKSTKAVVK
jgi:hypothetical protein